MKTICLSDKVIIIAADDLLMHQNRARQSFYCYDKGAEIVFNKISEKRNVWNITIEH